MRTVLRLYSVARRHQNVWLDRSRSPTHPWTLRSGLTLVEFLAALTTVGVLVAIMLPAVMSARESARRLQCRNHLRQIGLALHHYESTFRCFPAGADRVSFHVALLPYVDQTPLAVAYDAWAPIDWSNPGIDYHDMGLNALAKVRIPLFQCPSDPYSRRSTTNYAGNTGIPSWGSRFLISGNGFFRVGFRRTSEITDGLGNTVAVAEILTGNGMPDRRRHLWRTPYPLIEPDQREAYLHLCRETARHATGSGSYEKGAAWPVGGAPDTLYNHLLYPNDASCTNGPYLGMAAFSAGSEHAGGVHVCFADGSVRFMPTIIDLEIWRSIGTCQGGEPVEF